MSDLKTTDPLGYALREGLKQVKESQKSFLCNFDIYREASERLTATFRSQYESYIKLFSESLAKTSKRMAADAEATILQLAQRGWYFSPTLTMRQTHFVLTVFDQGAFRKADRMLIDHYTKHTSRFERDICKAYPHRASVVRQAFWAHRRRKYSLAVPVLLAQADGICLEHLNAQLFQRRKKRPTTADAVAALGPTAAAFLAPLMTTIPITASSQERATLRPDELNRHAILHGEETRYGTKVNSAKAISLVTYLSFVLPKLAARGSAR